MASKLRAYDDIKTISDFKADIAKHPEYTDNGFLNKESLALSLSILNTLTAEDEISFISYLKVLDKKMSLGGTVSANRFHKVPAALVGLIYMTLFRNEIKQFSPEELCIIAEYSVTEDLSLYQEVLAKINEPLLSVINKRGIDHMDRNSYLNLAFSMMNEGSTIDQVTEFIETTDEKTLKEKSNALENKEIEEAYRYL